MGLHLPPVALVNVWRQNHQAIATLIGCCLRQSDSFDRRERRDGRDHRTSTPNCFDTGAQYHKLLVERKGRPPGERSEGDESSTAIIEQPARVACHEAVINTEVL